jgi:hypothetical protein
MDKLVELEKYVGQFVKVGGHYGMIDGVYNTRLGFIWSDKDSWTGQICDVKDVEVLKDSESIGKARLSAKNHLLRERASLKARIARKLAIDNQQRLQELLDFVTAWIIRLGE